MDKNKKKKVYVISSIVGALVTFSVVGLLVANQGDAEKVTAPKQEVKTEKVKEEEKISYDKINNLDYEILSNEVVEGDGVNSVVFDIVSNAPLGKDELTALEQKVFELSQKDSDKEIKTIVIHVFSSNEDYNSVKENGYNGGKGLVVTVTGDHSQEQPVVKAKHYEQIEIPAVTEKVVGESDDPYSEDKGDIDAFDYDVRDVVIEGNKMTLDVTVVGEHSVVAEFIIGFVQVHRDLNPEVTNFALNLYNGADAKSPTWQYDGQVLTYEELLSVVQQAKQ